MVYEKEQPMACLIKGISFQNLPNKISGYWIYSMVQLIFSLNIDLGKTWKRLAQNFLTMEPFGLQLTPIRTSSDGLMTSFFEDWGDVKRQISKSLFLWTESEAIVWNWSFVVEYRIMNIKFYGSVLVGIQNTVPKFLSPLAVTFKTYRVRSKGVGPLAWPGWKQPDIPVEVDTDRL